MVVVVVVGFDIQLCIATGREIITSHVLTIFNCHQQLHLPMQKQQNYWNNHPVIVVVVVGIDIPQSFLQ